MELLTLLSVYYGCTALAEDGQLTQTERFACNASYQQVKRLFVAEDLPKPTPVLLTFEQNRQAYLRFKTWEAENADLVKDLKAYASR